MADDEVGARLRQAEFDLLYQRMMRRRAPSPVELQLAHVETPAQPAAEATPTAAAPATTPRKRRRREPTDVRITRAHARAERNAIVLADSDDSDDESSSPEDVAPSTRMDVDVPDNTDTGASPSLLLPLTATNNERLHAPLKVFLERTRQATPRRVRRSRKERHVHPPRYSVAAAQCYARLDSVAALLRPPDFAPTVVVFGSFGPLTTCAVPMPPRP